MISRHNHTKHSIHTISITNRNYLRTDIVQNENSNGVCSKREKNNKVSVEKNSNYKKNEHSHATQIGKCERESVYVRACLKLFAQQYKQKSNRIHFMHA